MTSFRNLEIQVGDSIATVTVSRPEKLNALNVETIREIGAAVRELIGDDSVRGIVVTGSGPRAFVAGADIPELGALGPAAAVELSRQGQAVFREIELSPKPFVAAVNGFALGGGCELALACHLRVAAVSATFGFPEVKLGIIPGYGGTVRLPRLVGQGRALELILTGEPVGAAEAHRIGLVNRVVPDGTAAEAARDILRPILENGPLAVARAIESITRGGDMGFDDGLLLESTLFGLLAATEDMHEGMSAFLSKRAPEFRGR
jgi:enoyl-CoA hydratase